MMSLVAGFSYPIETTMQNLEISPPPAVHCAGDVIPPSFRPDFMTFTPVFLLVVLLQKTPSFFPSVLPCALLRPDPFLPSVFRESRAFGKFEDPSFRLRTSFLALPSVWSGPTLLPNEAFPGSPTVFHFMSEYRCLNTSPTCLVHFRGGHSATFFRRGLYLAQCVSPPDGFSQSSGPVPALLKNFLSPHPFTSRVLHPADGGIDSLNPSVGFFFFFLLGFVFVFFFFFFFFFGVGWCFFCGLVSVAAPPIK